MDIKSSVKKIIKKFAAEDYQGPKALDYQEKHENTLALEKAARLYEGTDRDHVWAFISGMAGQDFRGNPKYLFVYINRYRPDIKAYWLCNDEDTLNQVRELGFEAYKESTPAAQYVINRTGVLVVEQVRIAMPDGFVNIKYINLWHGVGFKTIERRLFLGDIAMGFARKYVLRGTFYRDHQLLNASCPVIEEEFALDCGVDPDKFIRTGYPRNLYQQNYKPVVTFNHDLRGIKGLPADTKLAVYAPTYRANLGGTFVSAITDFDRLYQFCESHGILMIFKVHPTMEKEVGFLRAWEEYGDRPYFWFWDNRDDFYEVMHQMDLAIVDYTSLITDMVAVGIPHYIRYVFDYDSYMETVSVHDKYFERTTGQICKSFDELLEAMEDFESRDESAEIARLNELMWSYSEGAKDFDRIIDQALEFKVEKRHFPTLYSFDIFDTLFTRKVLAPEGIFLDVRERMAEEGSFPVVLTRQYALIRHSAEFNVREYYSKSQEDRQSDHVEITFDEIFDRIAEVYGLDERQVSLLKQWELEAELDNVVPLQSQIDLVKSLVEKGETVVLVSDMYLSTDFIRKMLEKADPMLVQLPLFVSSEYGVQKTSQKLFFEVYKSFEPYYDFEKWIHYGDNDKADKNQPRKFHINTRKIDKPEFNDVQQAMVKYVDSYDAYLVAAMQARLCKENYFEKDNFVISFVSLCFVPYIDWVLRDAQRRGYKSLYFVSRDGYHLKRIADEIIRERGLDFKTKYIYGSRRTWRIPAFIDKVDPGFWENYGSFADIISKDKLFSAMALDEETFRRFFPFIDPDNIDFLNNGEMKSLREIFRQNEEYNAYLLQLAEEQRELCGAYLLQEINPDEPFAIVEYYGRGYTQDLLVNLWRYLIHNDTVDVPFYYSRAIMPSQGGAVRHNFTTNDSKPYFIESIFANMPYRSIKEYTREGDTIVPVIEPLDCDKDLFDAMSRLLPEVAKRYARLELKNPADTDRMLYDFLFEYYQDNRDNPEFADQIGRLVDSVALYGTKREFAPPYTMEDLDMFEEKKIARGSMKLTTCVTMSVVRADEDVRRRYDEMFQITPGDALGSGRVLTEKERETNADFSRKYKELQQRAESFSKLYKEEVAGTQVKDKVVFVTDSKSIANRGLDLVADKLRKDGRYEVCELSLKKIPKPKDETVAKTIADARFIIINDVIPLFCKVSFRPETQEILLPENPFVLYNKGRMATPFLKWQKKYLKLSGINDISLIQVPAANRAETFRRSYCHSGLAKTELLGSCTSDYYYDKEYCKNARAKIESKFPEAKGKKIILYFPTWRTRKDCNTWLSLLDLEALQKLIGDEYVVVLNINESQVKHETMNRLEIPGFCMKISSGISYRQQLAAADIIIGDYRDTFFETPLMHKPAFSTAYDYESFIQANNMSQNANHFEELIFCPVVRTAEELADQLKNLDSYDYSLMERFRQEMYADCDGHSSQRVADYVLEHLD